MTKKRMALQLNFDCLVKFLKDVNLLVCSLIDQSPSVRYIWRSDALPQSRLYVLAKHRSNELKAQSGNNFRFGYLLSQTRFAAFERQFPMRSVRLFLSDTHLHWQHRGV